MTWFAWRLQRTETVIAVGILALLAALLIPTGISMANAYHHDALSSCLTSQKQACAPRIGSFQMHFQSLTKLADWFTLIPGLIGVLLAAPFILDLEHGTYRLAWTQGITRRRWLLGKLSLPILTSLVTSVALIALFTWWRAPEASLFGRLDTGIYDSEGTVIIGYTLFALGLALALGAIWRRSAVALAVAFVGYFAVRVFVDYWLRDRLVSPLHATWKGASPHIPNHAIVLSENIYVKGQLVSSTTGGFVAGHVTVVAPGLGATSVTHAVYRPASQFWQLQLTETSLFLAAGAALILFAAWWTHERVA